LKQIDSVGPSGEIIIDYSVYDAIRAGFDKVVFVISEAIEEVFRERVGRAIERCCDTAYVFQRLTDLPEGFLLPAHRRKPWGTAHAVLCARSAIDAPFAVINADDFYGKAAYEALARFLHIAHDCPGTRDYAMVGYLLGDTLTEHGHVARAVCLVDPDGYLVEINERLHIERFGLVARYTQDGGQTWVEIPLATPVSMNIWGFTPSLLAELETRFGRFLQDNHDRILEAEFLLPEVVGAMLREGQARVTVLPVGERWFGVTYKQDKPRVQAAIRELVERGDYPWELWGAA
jgi:hypothetical protein